MKIAVCSDEPYPVHATLRDEIESRGHECVSFGAFSSGEEVPWADVAEKAASAVASGSCDEGVFLCWSGTGIAMAANKVAGIRAALCTDPGMARAAREWNHATSFACPTDCCPRTWPRRSWTRGSAPPWRSRAPTGSPS